MITGHDRSRTYKFLQDGGEMGALTRAYDWTSTPIGPPDTWPGSLRSTLGIVLHSAFPMFLFWGEDLLCFYNDAFRPSLGIDGKHLALGKKGKEVWPEIWDFIGPLIQQVMTTGKPVWFEDQLVPFYRNGRIEDIYWTFSYSPAYGDDGLVSGVVVICTETTGAMKTRKSLEESEERFRDLVESASFPIGVYTGADLRVSIANQAILAAWGRDEKVIGKPLREVIPEMAGQAVFEELERVYTTGVPFGRENSRVELGEEGRVRTLYFNYSFIPLRNPAGQVYGVMATGADVTDLNLAKRQLEENEKNIRNTILKAPVAICIFRGPDYVVEIANDRMLELWGVAADQVMHRPIFEGLPEVRNQGFEALVHGVYHTGKAVSIQEHPIVLPRKGKLSNENEYVSFLYEPETGATGEIIGILAVAIIVTEQVRARQQIEELVRERTRELADANRNLERSNADLSQFAHVASHDLQEPIRKIITYSEMLEDRLGVVDPAANRYLDKITTAGNRMRMLVRDILTYSEVSQSSPAFEMIDLGQIVSGVLEEFDLLIEQKKATISVSALPTLPAAALQMQQLLGNLVSNALKYSKTDVPPIIDITADLEGDRWHVRVADNGIGFAPEYAQQIFTIFQRLHTKTDYTGTGVGLAICQKIVKNHRGEIYATSAPGEGAVFHVLLPAR